MKTDQLYRIQALYQNARLGYCCFCYKFTPRAFIRNNRLGEKIQRQFNIFLRSPNNQI